MAAAARDKPDNDTDEEFVQVPRDRFERLLIAMEQIVQERAREKAERVSFQKRAAKKVGPTTAAAMDKVREWERKQLRKKAGQ